MTVGRRWRGNKISAGETCSVTPPPRYSNREGCEVCQIGVAHSGAVKTPRLLSWWQPLTSVMVSAEWSIYHKRPVWTLMSMSVTFPHVVPGFTAGAVVAVEVEILTTLQHAQTTPFFRCTYPENTKRSFSSTVEHITRGSCIVQHRVL